jgi:hypothetical protein
MATNPQIQEELMQVYNSYMPHRNQKPKRHEIRGREHVVHSTHMNSCDFFKAVGLLFSFGGKFLNFFDKPS